MKPVGWVVKVLGKGEKPQNKRDNFYVNDLQVGDVVVFQTRNSRYSFGVVEKATGYLTVMLKKLNSRTQDARFTQEMCVTIGDGVHIVKGQNILFFLEQSDANLRVSEVEWLEVNGQRIF